MTEMMVAAMMFGLTLVVAQFTAGVILVKMMLREAFLRKYTKKLMSITDELIEEYTDDDM